MQTIYLDVLLFFNFCVNYFLLRGAACLTHTPCGMPRCILGALLGSIFSLAILLPPLPWCGNLLLRLGAVCCMTGILCFRKPWRSFLRLTVWLLCLSLLFAGFLMAVQQITGSSRILTGNHCFYLQFSLSACILCTIVAYGLLRLWHMVRLRCRHTDASYQVLIRVGTQVVALKGIADTGNNLADPFSGLPVIVCSKKAFSNLLVPCRSAKRHYHYLPYATVSGTGMMAVFEPDEILLKNTATGARHAVQARIGMAEMQEAAIFHPNLLQTV